MPQSAVKHSNTAQNGLGLPEAALPCEVPHNFALNRHLQGQLRLVLQGWRQAALASLPGGQS